MITGFFVDNTPWVEVVLTWGKNANNMAAILDTGFSGDLQVTPKIARELALPLLGKTEVKIANGSIVSTPVVLAATTMEGVHKQIQVLVSNGIPLLGINFLTRFSYKAIVDCKNRKISLNKLP